MIRRNLLHLAVAGLALALASGPASALTISATQVNSTTDNDNAAKEDATVTGAFTGGISSQTIADTVGNSATVEHRYAGSVVATDTGDITQTVDVQLTWTVTASPTVVYDVSFAPEFHALLKLFDELSDESGDNATAGLLSAVLTVNGSPVADTLDFTSGARTTDGTTDHDRTPSPHVIVGLSGTNTLVLSYTGTIEADGNDAALCTGNITHAAVMWGLSNSVVTPVCDPPASTYFTYTNSSVMAADGLFLPIAVTITAVPEPGTALLLGSGLLGLVVAGSRRA
jgi:hypothetical protein